MAKLGNYFKEATVEVVDCPDLRNAPFHLAAQGTTYYALWDIFNELFYTLSFLTEYIQDYRVRVTLLILGVHHIYYQMLIEQKFTI